MSTALNWETENHRQVPQETPITEEHMNTWDPSGAIKRSGLTPLLTLRVQTGYCGGLGHYGVSLCFLCVDAVCLVEVYTHTHTVLRLYYVKYLYIINVSSLL